MNRAMVVGFGAWLGLGTAGCGGKADGAAGASCGDVAACGGDITGTWQIASSCLDSVPVQSGGCTGLTTSVEASSASGTITFNADKTFQSSLTFSGTQEMHVPASCLSVPGGTLTCAQLEQSLETVADVGVASTKCSGSSDCVCSMVLTPQTSASSGTYTTSGGVVTQTISGGTPHDSAYCVKGNTLIVANTDTDSTGSITLTKQ